MNKNFKVDFLCVGFNKCGTTTLETLMKSNSDITLPKNKKETLFFDWYKNIENPLKVLQEKYYPDYLNSIGSIDPSYISKAKEVYEYFGKDVKLIFMLRNPIKATNSMFRMRLRRVPNKYYVNLYKKYNNLDDMFNDFIENQIKTKKCKDLTNDEITALRGLVDKEIVEGDLRREVQMNIKNKMEINSYQGIRHKKGLPVRGQRTSRNARTRKGKGKVVANKKKVGK